MFRIKYDDDMSFLIAGLQTWTALIVAILFEVMVAIFI